MNPVLTSLLPVVVLTALGWLVGRRGWLTPGTVKEMSNFVFVVLTPALLFRTMAGVRLQQVDPSPLVPYFGAVALIFVTTMAINGFNRRAAVLALANTFSNTVMMGIPLVGLAYGEAGLVTLFTLISVHSLVILTTATLVLEFAVIREAKERGEAPHRHVGHTLLVAVRNALIHPVPLPIIAGLLFAQTGLKLPAFVDRPLELLGQAFGPLALLMVGANLAAIRVGPLWRGALALAAVKNLLHPLLVGAIAAAIGMAGLPRTVMMLAAALPIGANVFMFSQRYEVAQELVTASLAVSTVMALLSTWLVMVLAG